MNVLRRVTDVSGFARDGNNWTPSADATACRCWRRTVPAPVTSRDTSDRAIVGAMEGARPPRGERLADPCVSANFWTILEPTSLKAWQGHRSAIAMQ
jgi:hypothetical protein